MIYKYMDLSTAHYTSEDQEWLQRYTSNNVTLPMRVIPHEYGYWINVSEDLIDKFEEHIAKLEAVNFSTAFIRVYQYAHENNCRWINFDRDADIDPILETFEW